MQSSYIGNGRSQWWVKLAMLLVTSGSLALLVLFSQQTDLGTVQVGPKPGAVSPSRLATLSRGVDLTLWFWVDNPYVAPVQSPDHYTNYITAADLQRIKQLGFRHVRLSITPAALFQEKTPEVLNPAVLPYLDKALDLILSFKLGVIIDMHFDTEGQDFKNRLVSDSSFATKYGQFWQSLAQHVSSRDPELVFLEVLNEPGIADPLKWYAVQEKILAAMRAGAPAHTLIADSNNQDASGNGEPSALVLMTPVSDPNVVYNLHFYEPQTFTGQGRPWNNLLKQITGLPYPYDATACQKVIDRVIDLAAKALATRYCNQQWDATKLDAKLKQVADWATPYGASVTVNEFGSYVYGIDKDSRFRWFSDLRSLFEKYGFGWTLWGYDDPFGLNRTPVSNNTLDFSAAQALGLDSSYSSDPEPGEALKVGNAIVDYSTTFSLTLKAAGSRPVTVSNLIFSGPAAEDYSLVSPVLPLALASGGAEQSLVIECTPGATGERTAVLVMTTDDPSQPTVSYPLECVGYLGLTVTRAVDPGGPPYVAGTLSYALVNVPDNQAIVMAPPGGAISITANLPPLKPHTSLIGRCGSDGPAIRLENTNPLVVSGLKLGGYNTVSGVLMKGFKGDAFKIGEPGNRFSCTATRK